MRDLLALLERTPRDLWDTTLASRGQHQLSHSPRLASPTRHVATFAASKGWSSAADRGAESSPEFARKAMTAR